MTTADLATIALPADLSSTQLVRVRALLESVDLVEAPDLVFDTVYSGPVCIVCHEGGKLGGHHDADGHIEWIHKGCHRRLHRRGQHRVRTAARRAAS